FGTLEYISPEQAATDRQGDLTPASDIYSLGATLYHLLTGRPAFALDPKKEPAQARKEVLERVRSGKFVPPRRVRVDVPPPLEAICLKAMAHEKEYRYQDARGLANEVQQWLADEPVQAWPEPWRERL